MELDSVRAVKQDFISKEIFKEIIQLQVEKVSWRCLSLDLYFCEN